MRAAWVTDAAHLGDLAPRIEELAAGADHPFALPYWHDAWIDAYGDGATRETCVVHDERGELVAVLPLLRRGRTLHAPANPEMPQFAFPARDAAATEAAWKAALGRAPYLEVRSLARPEPAERLLAASRSLRRPVLLRNEHSSPVIDLTVGFDAWRAWSKERWQAPLERYRRNLARREDATFEPWGVPADPQRAVEEALALEARGWKGKAGTAIVSQPETDRFYRSVLAEAARRGALRTAAVRTPGGLAAVLLGLSHGERAFGLRLAYDERLKRFAPGLVLMLGIVERVFEEGYVAYDFLGADEPYKLKFAQGERRHVAVRSYRPRLVPAGRWAVERGGQVLVRNVVRPLRERRAANAT